MAVELSSVCEALEGTNPAEAVLIRLRHNSGEIRHKVDKPQIVKVAFLHRAIGNISYEEHILTPYTE
jgi:hypothetical protein